jgi:succinoglycan biosynthesis transport protein ExoP
VQLLEALTLVRRQWVIVAVCVAVGLGLAGWRASPSTAAYSSSIQIFLTGESTGHRDSADAAVLAAARVPSYVELLKGNELAVRVGARLDTELGPADLVARVQAQSTPNTVVLTLTATDPEASGAEDLAGAVADELSLLIEDLEAPNDDGQPLIAAEVVGSPSPAAELPAASGARTLGLGGLLGFLLGFGLAFLSDRYRSHGRREPSGDENASAAADATA